MTTMRIVMLKMLCGTDVRPMYGTCWGLGLALLLMLPLAGPAQAQLIPSFGRDRAGTSGFQFLKIPIDARSAAMGETVAANAFDASALFWNPALAARATGPQAGFSHTAYLADVSMEYAALTVPIGAFTFGGSVQVLSAGEMDVTTEFEPTGTGETFGYVDLAAGLSVAQTLSDLFSYGVTAKYVRESTAGLATQTAMFDLGVFYQIGTTGAQMAVAIRNFGLDGRPAGTLSRVDIDEGVILEDDFETITPPTTFLLGLTYNAFRQTDRHDLLVSGQLTNPNDNAESFNVGLEYRWQEVLALRTGYRFGVEEITTPSFGLGLAIPGIGPEVRFDYAFSRMTRLGVIHRVGLNLSL